MSSSTSREKKRPINITNGLHNVAPELLQMKCIRFYIEFLRVSSQGLSVAQAATIKNHATFKIDFHGDWEGAFGIRIDMGPDLDSESIRSQNRPNSFSPGDLILIPRLYAGKSNSTCRTIELEFRKGTSLEQLLNSFMEYRLNCFSFICINGKYYGCHDFVAQALYMMQCAGFVSPDIIDTMPKEQELRVRDAYSALGMRFKIKPPGEGWTCAIDKGKFEYHARVEKPYMPYNGSQAADQLRNVVGR